MATTPQTTKNQSGTQLTEYDRKLVEFKRYVRDTLMHKVAAACPRGVQPNTIIRTLFNAIETTPELLTKCKPLSLGRALIRAATYGLEINAGQLGHAYIVPYGDEAVLQLSYKGVKELVRRSGEGVVIMSEVRNGDTFQNRGKLSEPLHIESDDPNRLAEPIVAAYAVMHFTNGMKISTVWPISKLLAHRDRYSKSWRNAKRLKKEQESPWHEDNPTFGKMCAKTCVHSLANDGDLPLSAEVRDLLRDNDSTQDDEMIPAASVQPVANGVIEPPTKPKPPSSPTPPSEPEPDTAPQQDDGPPSDLDLIDELTDAHIWDMCKRCTTEASANQLAQDLIARFPDEQKRIWDLVKLRQGELKLAE
jgi:recombination protein RecT